MRILICGDRNWDRVNETRQLLAQVLRPGDEVIHGDARGADRMAGRIAKDMGLKVRAYPANWVEHGRSAGPRRNEQMLREGKPEMVIALHDHIDKSKGTKHMVNIASNAGVDTFIFDGEVVRPVVVQQRMVAQ